MTDFGDFDQADATDTEPADPEQVARKLHRLREENGLEVGGWEDLDIHQRTLRIVIIAALLDWLRRQGSA